MQNAAVGQNEDKGASQIYYPGLGGPGSQVIGEEEEKEVMDVLRSKILARDRFDKVRTHFKTRSFEDEFRAYMKCKHALGVSNCTQGLVIALSALGIGPGDEVIVPAYTFIATAATVVAAKAIPVLAEIDESLGLDPKDVEAKITERTRCILPVHMKGAPCRMDELTAIREKYGLLMVEDVAQACGASYKGRMLGTFGDAGVFSFDYWKVITTGGGGMIITDDTEVYRTCVHYHDHGHEVYRENEDLGERPLIGLNFRMEEMEGAMGLAQLRKLPRMTSAMRQNSRAIWDGIKDIDLFNLRDIPDPDGDLGNGVTVLARDRATASALFSKLAARGIEVEWLTESGWHNYCNWKQLLKKKTLNRHDCPFGCPFYGREVEYYEGMCPQTDGILERAVTINYNATLLMDQKAVDALVKEVREACGKIA